MSGGLYIGADTSGSALLIPTAVSGSTQVTIPAGTGTMAVQGASTNIVSGTAVSASSTAVSFTGIPSWVKRITFMLYGASSNGSSNWLVQLGTSAGFTTTGYLGSGSYEGGVNICGGTNFTAGFGIMNGGTAQVFHGQIVLSLFNPSTNVWVATGTYGDSSQSYTFMTGGSVQLASVATQIRIATLNGSDTFDAGNFNILYE